MIARSSFIVHKVIAFPYISIQSYNALSIITLTFVSNYGERSLMIGFSLQDELIIDRRVFMLELQKQ